ncbi:MAG: hypothetical protein AAF149_08250 [Bacteroidota bacterium]
MITRYWKGVTYPDKADNYAQHLNEDTLPILRKINGFVGMQILRREVSTGIDHLGVNGGNLCFCRGKL